MSDYCPHCGGPMSEPAMIAWYEEGQTHLYETRRCKNQECGYELKVEVENGEH